MSDKAVFALLPRDGFFCKDGRGWHTSASGRGRGLDWPMPSTLLGAVRTAWGRAEESVSGAAFGRDDWIRRTKDVSLGRTVALRRQLGVPWCGQHRLWPVPADALHVEGGNEVLRLDPIPPQLPTLGRDDDSARELLWVPGLTEAAKPLPSPRWWSDKSLAAWLAGQPVEARAPGTAFEPTRRIQVRIGVSPETLTADDGALFSHDVVETLEPDGEWAVGLEVVLPGGNRSTIATLGADARLARVEALDKGIFDPPEQVLGAFRPGTPGLRLVVATPAAFKFGWLPDGIDRLGDEYRGHLAGIDGEVVLRAAFVSRPVHVSGWSMASREPKPTTRMVAPGAVYFFVRADGRPFGEPEARALWLGSVGSRAEEGFGRVVPGIWNPRRSTLR